MLDLRLAVEPEDHTDEGLVLRAFQELPERWQLVLWHTEIEGQPPAAVAPLLGLSPNATAALAVRAREGLRQAYLQAHLQSRPAESCRFSVEHLGSFVRDGLGKRDNAKVEAHLGRLRGVPRAAGRPRLAEQGPAQRRRPRRARRRRRPLAAGPARPRPPPASGPSSTPVPVAHRLRFPQAVGLAGAAAALFVTLGVSSDLGRPPTPRRRGRVASAVPAPRRRLPSQVVDAALAGTPARSDARRPASRL